MSLFARVYPLAESRVMLAANRIRLEQSAFPNDTFVCSSGKVV